eukprot:scaffold21210_cov53-Attheya_sp.AAC.4
MVPLALPIKNVLLPAWLFLAFAHEDAIEDATEDVTSDDIAAVRHHQVEGQSLPVLEAFLTRGWVTDPCPSQLGTGLVFRGSFVPCFLRRASERCVKGKKVCQSVSPIFLRTIFEFRAEANTGPVETY